jgi:type IV pilus assembly protein PilB
MPIDKTLIKNGIVAEKDIATALAAVLGVPFIDLADYLVDTSVVKLIPEPIAQKYKLIPIFKVGQTLTIAMANPQDVNAIDQVRLKAKCEVEPVLATETAIKHAIDQYYGIGGSIEDVIKGMHDAKADLTALEISSKDLEKLDLNKLADAPPVIKLVNLIIMQAIKDKASDIHIEPEEKALRVRYRIDGILHEGSNPPKALEPAIVSRIKVLASMDIAEKRKPQDGRIQLKMQGGAVDMRVSSFPTVYGENIVIRILDTSNLRLELTELGMSPVILEEFSRLIKKPFGIILVTGPTGSGKTTTLYAALSAVNSVEKNIITIEDPVEYQLKMIRQTQINPKAGLTFASGLRSILRQDPDIIMVGEIRDSETAEIATQAALTGHLVFSTLHTNDATGAVTRLIDMGIEPFLISSSVIGALAQRLVRVICPKCKDKISPTDDMLKDLGIGREANILFYKGKGCTHCKDTGYLGRTGIYELLIIDDDIKRLIINKADANEMKKKAIERGMKTLRDDGIAKVLAGITTVEEILRVTQEE